MCTTPNGWPGCWRPPDTSARPTAPTPTSWCSTPARFGRTPTTSSTATSATWRRASRPTPTCRSPSAVAWPRRTATPCCGRPHGWTSCSAPTTSGRCRRCSTAPATTRRPRSKSSRRCRNSRPRCPPRANPLTPHGFRSPSAATTPARSASCPRCAARRSTAGPATCWPRCGSLVDQGVLEVTLLGQNVNAYGVSFADPDQPRDRGAFAKLLRACGRIDGLERVRFTSPHPAEFTDDVIEAMAETPNVCPTLHMPMQSGSDRMLRAMRRSYRSERYLGIIDKVRAAIPHAAITTDLIVGFPGETEEDFQATLDVVAAARFTSAFTFQYSKRPGTPAAELDGQLPKAVVQERYQRLIDLQETDLAGGEHRADRPHRRAAGGHGRRPQGRQHRPDVRAGPRRPAGAFHPGGRRHPAGGRRHHHRDRRRAAPPDRRRRPAHPSAHPGRRRARRRASGPAPVSASACPVSASRRSSRPSTGCAR